MTILSTRQDGGALLPDGAPVSAFQLVGLHKVFGDTVTVDQVDVTVPQGSFFGLVGPNGAGKTTLLSMAVGLLRPTAGAEPIDVSAATAQLECRARLPPAFARQRRGHGASSP
jgi:ABC-type branched-subunit amino acid transport system ATPase component